VRSRFHFQGKKKWHSRKMACSGTGYTLEKQKVRTSIGRRSRHRCTGIPDRRRRPLRARSRPSTRSCIL
jgi:hypothetical protein